MRDLTVTFPDDLYRCMERRAAEHRCASVNDYLEHLVRQDLLEECRDEIEAKLLEALQSPASEMTAEDWDDLRRRAAGKPAARTTS
jgi:hypothetical protein